MTLLFIIFAVFFGVYLLAGFIFSFTFNYLFEVIMVLSILYMLIKNRQVLGFVLISYFLYFHFLIDFSDKLLGYENEWVFPFTVIALLGVGASIYLEKKIHDWKVRWALEFTGGVLFRSLMSLLVVIILGMNIKGTYMPSLSLIIVSIVVFNFWLSTVRFKKWLGDPKDKTRTAVSQSGYNIIRRNALIKVRDKYA